MADTAHLTAHYDRAAPRWGDKMRALGYADAYLGFLAAGPRADPAARACDVGCGTGAFAAAWQAIHGPGARLTLLDPSGAMLDRAAQALERRGAPPETEQAGIDDFHPQAPFDHLLVAHVLEHVPDPLAALRRMRGWVRPGAALWLAASKPHWCNAIIWLQWRHRTFQATEMTALLADAGWRLEQVHAFPSGPPSRTSRGYIARAA